MLSDDEYRIILTWGATPSDLDSHLVGPNMQGTGNFQVYFGNKQYKYEDIVYAELDVDDTTSSVPDTITIIKPIVAGTYKYSVHDFTNVIGDQVN